MNASLNWKLFIASVLGLSILGLWLFFALPPTDEETKMTVKGNCTAMTGKDRKEEASCKNFGGCHGYCPDSECQCTSQCINVGNCCEDFSEECMTEGNAHTELIKLEEQIRHMEHGEGIVGSEFILGLVMVFFIVSVMGLVYISHNPKLQGLRKMADEMSCKTTSIFAANTFSVALHGVLIEQIWMGKHPGLNLPAGPLRLCQIYGVVACLFFVASNVLMYLFRGDPQLFFAIGQLSSHMTAFTLVRALGSLQWSVRDSTLECCMVLAWAAVFLRGSIFVGERVRSQFIKSDMVQWEYREPAKRWQPFPSDISKKIESDWGHRAADTDSDSDPSVVFSTSDANGREERESFSVLKTDLTITFNPDEPSDKSTSSVLHLPDRGTFFVDPCGRMVREGGEEWKVRWQCNWHHFAEECFLDGAGLVMGFLMMQLVLLLHTGYLHSTEGLLVQPDDWDWMLTFSVLCWSFGFSVLVVIVEAVTDHLPPFLAPDLEMLAGSFSAAFGWCLLRGAALTVRPHCTLMDTYVVVAFPLTWLALLATVFAHTHLPNILTDHGREDVQHTIASAAAIVTGLVWDKAFESLTVHMTSGWYGHYVIAKVILAAVVAIIVLPGWYMYLVPKAVACCHLDSNPDSEEAEPLK